MSDWSPSDAVEPRQLVDSLLDWCKDTLAECRRPYGVDHFDLVLAVGNDDYVRNLSFSRLRILQLYEDDLGREILALITREAGQAVHLAAGLFSWGDALHSALQSEAAGAN